MRRLFSVILACLIGGTPALAQMAPSVMPGMAAVKLRNYNLNTMLIGPPSLPSLPPGIVPPPFKQQFLCDIQPQTAFWGVFACSAAEARQGTQPVFDLQRAGDNATCTVPLGTAGLGVIDLTVQTPCNSNTQTVTAWQGGSNATCTGSIATTTLTVSSCSSGTLAVNDHITGTGVTAQTFITVIGTCATPPGTCTLSKSQSVASETLTAAPPDLFVTTAYDHTNGTKCNTGSINSHANCNLFNPGSNMTLWPKLVLTGCGASGILPCVSYTDGTSCCQLDNSNNHNFNASPSFTMYSIQTRSSHSSSNEEVFTSGTQSSISRTNTTSAKFPTLSGPGVTTTDTWHVINGTEDGAAATLNVDNAEATSNIAGVLANSYIGFTLLKSEQGQMLAAGFADKTVSTKSVRNRIAKSGCNMIGTKC